MTVFIEDRDFQLAQLGPENPLAHLAPAVENHYRVADGLPDRLRDGVAIQRPSSIFPYSQQDGYGREVSGRTLRTVVLQNSRLRAVVLPELGGRIWELTDASSGKNIVHTPHAIQFANLGLRNAWFAGGIEWNIGTQGHSPTTCSPLHTAIVRTRHGQDVLRMWEFERLRGVVFQVDLWLPEDSAVLFAAVRIRNPNPSDVPMYWWTNAAVPITERTRVLAPAQTAFTTDDHGTILRTRPTDQSGIDGTWPARNRRARDYFFDIAAGQRSWVTSCDADGDGLAMASTKALAGRKLFVWGSGTGGERWQRWLSGHGRYAEIQAGLTSTQYEHLLMPPSSELSWVEAYGNPRMDPALTHGGDRSTPEARNADWNSAVEHAEERVDVLISQASLEAAAASAASWADMPPGEPVVAGSGWGALEADLRSREAAPWVDESGTPFARETLTALQQPWATLLADGTFSGSRTYVAGDAWERRLAAADRSEHTLMQLAVLAHACGELSAAAAHYRAAIELARSAHTLAMCHRGLALVAAHEDPVNIADTRGHYLLACQNDPTCTPLLIEAATTALALGGSHDALRIVDAAASRSAGAGRLQLIRAHALAEQGRMQEAGAVLRSRIEVADLREGDNTIYELWRRALPGQPVPETYQFSMTTEE